MNTEGGIYSLVFIAMIGVLFFLNGCAVIRPITQLVGGAVNIASGAVGIAAKAAPVVLPFLLL